MSRPNGSGLIGRAVGSTGNRARASAIAERKTLGIPAVASLAARPDSRRLAVLREIAA